MSENQLSDERTAVKGRQMSDTVVIIVIVIIVTRCTESPIGGSA